MGRTRRSILLEARGARSASAAARSPITSRARSRFRAWSRSPRGLFEPACCKGQPSQFDPNDAAGPDEIEIERNAPRCHARRARAPRPLVKIDDARFMQLLERAREVGDRAMSEGRKLAHRGRPPRRDQMQQREVFLRDNSLTIASGEAVAPSAFAAVASLSNQRLGVVAATAGSVTTRLVHFMNSPVPIPRSYRSLGMPLSVIARLTSRQKSSRSCVAVVKA